MADPVSTYSGNLGLGIGSNPQIPVPGDTNLKVINDTLRDITLLSHERNLNIFKQKVADRNTLTQLIADNQVNPGNLDPKYLGKYNEGRDAATKAFDEWRGNFNDHDGYRKYQEAITNLREIVAHGGANTIELQKLRQQAAQEQLPSKKADILRHIKEQEDQSFEEPVKPYQQFRDLNPQTFSGFVEPIKSEVRDPNNPALTFDQSKIDYGSILRNSRNAYVHDLDKQNDIRQLYDKFSNYDQDQLPKAIDAMNKQIDKYNGENGYAKGQPGYVDPVNAPVVNGKMVIKEFPADFAAKYALANNEDFITKTQKYDYKLLSAQAAATRNKIATQKLGVDWYNAKTRRNLFDLKKRQVDNADEVTKNISQGWDQMHEEINLPEPVFEKMMGVGDAPFQLNYASVPKGQTFNMGLNEKGQPIQLIPKGLAKDDPGIIYDKNKKIIGYNGDNGHYDINYFVPSGTVIRGTTIKKDIKLGTKDLYNLYEKSGYKGEFKDFINDKFKNKELDYQMEGSNGKATRVSSWVSQMALGNKLTKKGQENPFANDESELFGPSDEQSNTEEPSEPEAQ